MFDMEKIPTPCYVVDEERLLKNMQTFSSIKERTGCSIILALKAFAMFELFPLMRKYLDGTTASSLNEARLGAEEFRKDVHTYIPVYRDEEIEEICTYASHISFNSLSQWNHFKLYLQTMHPHITCGVRINPEYSLSPCSMYDPCAKHSRLGVTIKEFAGHDIEGLEGFHFHTLCQQNVDALANTLKAIEDKFGKYLYGMKWVNFGGGHHITRSDYDVDLLCELITNFQKKYDIQDIILEPGEAIGLNAGFMVTTVLDVVYNEMDIAVLDTSAAAHMPDILEMPYRAPIVGSGVKDEFKYNYRLTGNSCLSGDIMGDYSFPEPLDPGTKIIFEDMAHYTMVKNTTFNGINLPSIALYTLDKELKIIKEFGYEDFKSRLS